LPIGFVVSTVVSPIRQLSYPTRTRQWQNGAPGSNIPERTRAYFTRLQTGEFWCGDLGLTIISIALIIFTLVILPLHNAGLPGRFVFDLLIVTLMIFGALAVGKSRIANLLTIIIVLAGVLVLWASAVYATPVLHELKCVFSIAVLILYIRIVLLIMFRHGPITWSRMQGGVSAYLLLGLLWASGFHLVELMSPGSFHFVSNPMDFDQLSGKLIYFSFATLTTVGFGDVTPIHPIARSLAIAEAVVGRLCPAIFIDALVAMAVQSRPKS